MNMPVIETTYTCQFSVHCLPDTPQLFLLNMEVYDVRPVPVPQTNAGPQPVGTIWCAVFHGSVSRKP